MQNSVYVILGTLFVIGLIVLIGSYFISSCNIDDCDIVVTHLSYSAAVKRLKEILMENPENKDRFIENFFRELETVCVASEN